MSDEDKGKTETTTTATPTATPPPAAAAPATPAAKPAAGKAPPSTVLADPGDGGSEIIQPTDFPDDWRGKMAGEDKALAKRLERMKSPRDVAQWALNAEKQWKQGADPDPFPAEGTDEEKGAWRKARGIPEQAEDYDIKLDGGLVIGDNDKPLIGEFLKAMHEDNAPPAMVKKAVTAYYTIQDRIAAERADRDERDKTTARDALRDEMGRDFGRRLSSAYGLLDFAPEGVKDKILGARLGDGTALGNDADTLRWLINMSAEINPAGTVTPASGGTPGLSIEAEIAEIHKKMADSHSEYWTGPKTKSGETVMAARYRELDEAREKLQKRGRAA